MADDSKADGDAPTKFGPREGKVVLGYWAIRGLAQPIRYILEYSGADYVEDRYVIKKREDGSWDRTMWMDVKFSMPLEYPNLPYLFDGEVAITQSNACLRHVARKCDLLGSGAVGQAHVDMMLDVAMDFRNTITRTAYGPKEEYPDRLARWIEGSATADLKHFEAHLGDREWFVDNALSCCDFVMYELLDQSRLMAPDVFARYPKLGEFLTRFEALPAIAKYQKTEACIVHPINNLSAAFL